MAIVEIKLDDFCGDSCGYFDMVHIEGGVRFVNTTSPEDPHGLNSYKVREADIIYCRNADRCRQLYKNLCKKNGIGE